MAQLELRGVEKTFPGGIAAARAVDLTVEDGELFVIVGPSGSGKSTLLRLIAGLESIDGGQILLDGRRIDGLSPTQRDVAMVFQDQVLYPHLNVFDNIAFGLQARGVPRREIDDRVQGTSQVLGLAECLERSPSTLSGGQRRRVALGRALVLRPKLFLFDEPFSGLDAPLRASTRAELADLKRKLNATMVLVTHDQGEALAMGDRVAVIDQGQVVQVGPPLEIYDRPNHRSVARFIGQPTMNILPCRIERDESKLTIQIVETDDIPNWSIDRSEPFASVLEKARLPRVDLGIRPEQILVRSIDAPTDRFEGSAIVKRLEPTGHETLVYLDCGSQELTARLPARTSFRVGDPVRIAIDLERACWFDPDSGHRLG